VILADDHAIVRRAVAIFVAAAGFRMASRPPARSRSRLRAPRPSSWPAARTKSRSPKGCARESAATCRSEAPRTSSSARSTRWRPAVPTWASRRP